METFAQELIGKVRRMATTDTNMPAARFATIFHIIFTSNRSWLTQALNVFAVQSLVSLFFGRMVFAN